MFIYFFNAHIHIHEIYDSSPHLFTILWYFMSSQLGSPRFHYSWVCLCWPNFQPTVSQKTDLCCAWCSLGAFSKQSPLWRPWLWPKQLWRRRPLEKCQFPLRLVVPGPSQTKHLVHGDSHLGRDPLLTSMIQVQTCLKQFVAIHFLASSLHETFSYH